MSQQDMDQLRADLARTTDLAKALFEQQFIRCGGRMPADPSWDDLEEVERDDWWDRAVDARPLLDQVLWLHAEAVWLGQVTQEVMLRALAGSRRRVHELVDEKAAVEASRRDWAAEAARLQHELEELTVTFHERAARRSEACGDGPHCDGDCDNGDCHMTSAVSAWQMAAAAVQRRLAQVDDANSWSLPLCAVHPEVRA